MLPKLPDILHDAKDTLITNFPPDRLGDMLEISQRVDDKNITRKVLNAPYSNRPPSSTTGGLYILKLDMKRLAKLSVDLFGQDSRYYEPPVAGASPSPSVAP